MQVRCSTCGRSFELDEARARKVRSARCLCGGAIDLRTPAVAQRLGHYVLQQRIALGGMGEIWRAKMAGIEGFERDVAIKKMLPHLSADRAFVDMLVKEAKLTVLLHHPNIVQVYDLAKEGDEYYIAMEYVPSVNLSALLEYCANRGMFTPVPVAVSAALQTLEALGYAHTLPGPDGEPMNILHRDITPQNILVTRDGWVKVTDFGIAKAKNEITTTRPGTIRGKLGYIAPEQLETKDADERVDIFCAGIVLWESLATRRLFKGTDEIDTLRLVVGSDVPSLTTMRPDMPPALDAAVARALARDPARRYPSAAAFRDGLLAAIAPATADDYLKATKRFLAEQGELFGRRPSQGGGDVAAESPTVALDTTPGAADAGSGEVTITELVVAPRRVRRLLPALVAAAVVAAAGAGLWWWQGRGAPRGGPLTQAEVQAAVDGLREQLQPCYAGGRAGRDLAPRATLAVLSSGRVADVAVAPASLGKAAACLAGVLQSIQMRAHPEARFETTIDLPRPHDARVDARAPSDDARRPLAPEEIQKAVKVQFAAIARCLSQLPARTAPDTIVATLQISARGTVDTVELDPALGDPGATRCLVTTIKSMRFRANKGVEVKIPLTIQRFTTGK